MSRELENYGIYPGVVIRGHMCFDNVDINRYWPNAITMFSVDSRGIHWDIPKLNAYMGQDVFSYGADALLSKTVWEALLDLMEERGDL